MFIQKKLKKKYSVLISEIKNKLLFNKIKNLKDYKVKTNRIAIYLNFKFYMVMISK